jgi:lipoprotein signal peptidase
MTATARIAPKWLLLLATVGLTYPLDRVTKHWIIDRLAYGERIPIIEGFFDLTHVRNPGGAFSFLADAAPEIPSLRLRRWVRFSAARRGTSRIASSSTVR